MLCYRCKKQFPQWKADKINEKNLAKLCIGCLRDADRPIIAVVDNDYIDYSLKPKPNALMAWLDVTEL